MFCVVAFNRRCHVLCTTREQFIPFGHATPSVVAVSLCYADDKIKVMKRPQFTLGSLLILTAFFAICFSGFLMWRHYVCVWDTPTIASGLGFNSAVWMPLMFFAYSLGHRKLTWQSVVVFAFAEAAAIAVAHYGIIPAIWPSTNFVIWPSTNF